MSIWMLEPGAQDLPWGTIDCQHVQQKMERQLFMQTTVAIKKSQKKKILYS